MADTRMCLADGRPLIQLRHTGLQCRQFVVQDEPNAVTVSYTCGTAGSGMTRMRMENDSLVQIETQGIAHGLLRGGGPARGGLPALRAQGGLAARRVGLARQHE
jgi:hypothetical protein